MADRKEDEATKKRRELAGKHGQALPWAEKHGPSVKDIPGEHVLTRATRAGEDVVVTVDGAKLTNTKLAAAHGDLVAAGLKEPESRRK
jgi:hypothetical protein